jgi:hypothetical protein
MLELVVGILDEDSAAAASGVIARTLMPWLKQTLKLPPRISAMRVCHCFAGWPKKSLSSGCRLT